MVGKLRQWLDRSISAQIFQIKRFGINASSLYCSSAPRDVMFRTYNY